MRLLHTKTLELHEFIGDHIPPYAILSHRWEDAEVTFQDLRDGRGAEKGGWTKIVDCCKQAAKDTFEYTVSTCFLRLRGSFWILSPVHLTVNSG